MAIDDYLRALVVRRSNFQCSYCHTSLNDKQGTVDHIFPRARGGGDDLNNLTFACGNCNTRKGDRIRAVDPVTNEEAPLFNPNNNNYSWYEHFHTWAGEVCGKTPIGRATAHLLFQRYDYDVYQREWTLLDRIDNDRIRNLLAQERGNRLRNRFDQLLRGTRDGEVRRLFSSLEASQQREVLRAATILAFEQTCMEGFIFWAKRDLTLINKIRPYLKHPDTVHTFRRLVNLNEAILLGHLATIEYLNGNYAKAQDLQHKAAKADLQGCKKVGSGTSLKDRTRQAMLRTKYEVQPDFGSFGRNEIKEAVQEALEGDTESITYLAAWALAGKNIRKHRVQIVESAGEIVTWILERCGYGLSYNVGSPIILRRRWWPLQLVNAANFNEALMESDLQMWMNYGMHNEIRSLAATLMHTHQVMTLRHWSKIDALLKKYLSKVERREIRTRQLLRTQKLFGLGRYRAVFEARLI